MSPLQIQYLKGLAHPLKPVVQVGNKGVTPALLEQITEQLDAHELIKVRFNTGSEGEPKELAQSIAADTRSTLVQKTGRILVLYRRHDTKPQIRLPSAGGKGAGQ